MDEAAKSLKFLVEAGLVNGLNTDKILELAETPKELPMFFGAAIRDGLISPSAAKTVLKHLEYYKGEINDQADQELRNAVAEFQLDRNLVPDGYIGPVTYGELRKAWPDYFESEVQVIDPQPGPSGSAQPGSPALSSPSR